MDQFDQLIKEKAEKKEFKYKPLFWLLFAKSAGISAFSAIQIIAGVVVVSGVIGGATYFGIKNHANKEIKSNPRAIIDSTHQINSIEMVSDTIQVDTVNHSFNQDLKKPKKTKVSVPKTDSIIKVQEIVPQKGIQDSTPPKKIYRDPYVGRRILTIDTDTILTND